MKHKNTNTRKITTNRPHGKRTNRAIRRSRRNKRNNTITNTNTCLTRLRRTNRKEIAHIDKSYQILKDRNNTSNRKINQVQEIEQIAKTQQ